MTGSLNTSDEVRRWVAQSLAIDAHTAEVVTALNAAGIPSVLLKGPSIARWLYTDGTPRPYGDTDLLVPDDRMPEVERVLEGLGLSRRRLPTLEADLFQHAREWARPDGSGNVDLHSTLPMVRPGRNAWAVIFRDAEPMLVAGCEVRIGSEALRTLLVALHAAHHGPSHVRPIEDLGRALDQLPFDTWIRARSLAEELDAVAAMALGLNLVPDGAVMAQYLSIDATAATPELVLRAEGASRPAQTLARMFEQPTWRRRARLARARIIPPVEFVRAWELEQRGTPDANLVAAYLRRLMSVARTAPTAVWSYARLRGRSNRP